MVFSGRTFKKKKFKLTFNSQNISLPEVYTSFNHFIPFSSLHQNCKKWHEPISTWKGGGVPDLRVRTAK